MSYICVLIFFSYAYIHIAELISFLITNLNQIYVHLILCPIEKEVSIFSDYIFIDFEALCVTYLYGAIYFYYL